MVKIAQIEHYVQTYLHCRSHELTIQEMISEDCMQFKSINNPFGIHTHSALESSEKLQFREVTLLKHLLKKNFSNGMCDFKGILLNQFLALCCHRLGHLLEKK